VLNFLSHYYLTSFVIPPRILVMRLPNHHYYTWRFNFYQTFFGVHLHAGFVFAKAFFHPQ
ncbi:MAG: hypothetical protein IKC45_05785, partial [Clostridia bacterium]|nr:hypothetical protein [Clostridia bacterium]